MPITQAIPTSFKTEILTGTQMLIMSGMDEVDILIRFGISSTAQGINISCW